MSIEKSFDSAENKKLVQIRNQAKNGDITYNLQRHFHNRLISQDPEILKIQKQGFISAAKRWLEATTDEGMKFGNASKDERMAKAKEFADKAGISMEELLNQNE